MQRQKALIGFKLQAAVNDPRRTQDHQPLANDGGVSATANDFADPYQALDDLMAVVEALCPEWPERDIFRDGGRMLL